MLGGACVIGECSYDDDVITIECDGYASVVFLDECFCLNGFECCCECVRWKGFDLYVVAVVIVVVVAVGVVVVFVGLREFVECLGNVFWRVSMVAVVE